MSNYLKRFIRLNLINTRYSLALNTTRLLPISSKVNAEERIKNILNKTFPQAKSVEVVDISGGCGAMYDIAINAPEFKGLSMVKQHKLVTEALKEEIKDMHGLRIQTRPT